MRNKWAGYAAALLLTAALVTSSVFMPSILLEQRESRILGNVNFVDNPAYKARTYPQITLTPTKAPPSPATPTPLPEPTEGPLAYDTRQLLQKILLMEQYSSNAVLISEPAADDIGMKDALAICYKQLAILMKANAIPALANFPGVYSTDASLWSVSDDSGTSFFDYWTISINTNPKLTKRNGGISLILDARTGSILSIKMYSGSINAKINLAETARILAANLRVDGILNMLPAKKGEPEMAQWIAKDKSLYIIFYLSTGTGGTSLTMNISTHPVFR